MAWFLQNIDEASTHLNALYLTNELIEWEALSDSDKTVMLNKAYRDVTSAFIYEGTDEYTEEMLFAREEAFKKAQAEQAFYLLNGISYADEARKSGISSGNIGSISFNLKNGDKYRLCREAYEYIARYIKKPEIVRG
jgi:hypothetical protein